MSRTLIASPFTPAEEALMVLMAGPLFHKVAEQDPKFIQQAAEALGLDVEDDTLVRSYDHAGDFGVFVEGLLEATGEDVIEGCPRYRIKPVHRYRDGKCVEQWELGTADRVYPPVNGTRSTFGTCQGVFRADAPHIR